MSDLKAVAHNTVFQLVGKIVSMTLTLGLTYMVTRAYGAEGYGIFNLITNFPAIFYIIADFGLNAVAVRDLSKNEEKIGLYLGNVVLLRFLLSVLLILVAFFTLNILNYTPEIKMGIVYGLLTILTVTLFACANIGFQVKLRYDLSQIALLVGNGVAFFLVLGLILSKASILYSGLAIFVGGLVTLALASYFLSKLSVHISWKKDVGLIKSILSNSLPLGLMFVFSQINLKADSILLSTLKLPSELGLSNIQTVGIYGLAYKIFEVSLVVPTFIMNSAYPILNRKYKEGKEPLFSYFKKLVLVLGAIGVCASLGGIVFSDLIIQVVGGADFHLSAQVLRTLLGLSVIFYLTQPLAWLLVTLDQQKYLPLIYLIACAVNVTANIIFIPKYSFFASANITWFSELVILLLLAVTALKVIKEGR